MEFVVISGLSGAGKSRIALTLEDMGYYCVDNMPVVFIPKFAELCLATKGSYEKAAIVSDVRGGQNFDVLLEMLDKLTEMGVDYKLVFVEAVSEVIVRRYKETRRSHPLDKKGELTVEEAVAREREMLMPIRNRASYIINTSSYSVGMLRSEVVRLFSGETDQKPMMVQVRSFGFKHGIPIDADIVFDVRFLPNPYYVEQLKDKTGLDPLVYNFVFSYTQTLEFMAKMEEMIEFLLPQYMDEGKTSLTIAIGCTGGRHRSVAVAEELAKFIARKGYNVASSHLHINK